MSHANDLATVMQRLDQYKHWTVRCVNRDRQRRRYECVIWGDGKRKSCTRGTPLAAMTACLEEIEVPVNRPGLRLVQ